MTPVKTRNPSGLQTELQRRYETRVTRCTVLTEVTWAVELTQGAEKAGRVALAIIKNLDRGDDWWSDRDHWLMSAWLKWAEEEVNKKPEIFHLKEEPTEGFQLLGLSRRDA